jgi:hypothetical protein
MRRRAAVRLLGPAERMFASGPANLIGVPMPVTAKLSRKFYDTFGDDIANELVT